MGEQGQIGTPPACDVAIVGGGLVGISLALALAELPVSVQLIEATTPVDRPPSFDGRHLVLGRAAINALTRLGVIDRLASPPLPVRSVHVTSRGDFGCVVIEASDAGLERLGGVVIAADLGRALEASFADLLARPAPSRIASLRPATLRNLSPEPSGWRLQLDSADGTNALDARLVVGADGASSKVREFAQLPQQSVDRQASIIVATAASTRPIGDRAFERFDRDGPVAILPAAGGRIATILTVPAERAGWAMALSDADYARLLQERFGWRLGRIDAVGPRHGHPLRSALTESVIASALVLIGNAAQTLHPLGAQGFNLGLRDALTLAELIEDRIETAGAFDAIELGELLADYSNRRSADRDATVDFADGLAGLFGDGGRSELAGHVLRSLGLGLGALMPLGGSALAFGAAGFRGDVPRLARESAIPGVALC